MSSSVLGSSPAHYKRLGLETANVLAWEDGLRTNPHAMGFEWWYCDFVLEDGTKLAVALHTKPPFSDPAGPLQPFVNVMIARPDGTLVQEGTAYEAKDFVASTQRCDVQIGNNRIVERDDGVLGVSIKLDTIVIDAELVPEVPPWRPQTGHVFFGSREDRQLAWLVMVPRGQARVCLRRKGLDAELRGSGYHDHNWGNCPLHTIVDHWYWGRAQVGNVTALCVFMRASDQHGGANHSALMLAKGSSIVVSAVENIIFEASGVETIATTGVPAATLVTFAWTGNNGSYSVSFSQEKKVYEIGLGEHGAYHRFSGRVLIDTSKSTGGDVIEGPAIWELLHSGGVGRAATVRQWESASGEMVHVAS
jgi:hypothetical protein